MCTHRVSIAKWYYTLCNTVEIRRKKHRSVKNILHETGCAATSLLALEATFIPLAGTSTTSCSVSFFYQRCALICLSSFLIDTHPIFYCIDVYLPGAAPISIGESSQSDASNVPTLLTLLGKHVDLSINQTDRPSIHFTYQ